MKILKMALNKYMHPRNIYKVPPDFYKLAKLYEDFAAVVKCDVSGKMTLDFKNPSSLRILTKCLLKSDFNLDVKIPEDRLVPTLPLRLNYILWLEDLLSAFKWNVDISGIDIGTGACAIYPLLAAKKNKWQILGTETDRDSLEMAQENIDKNQLSKLVRLSYNSTKTIIEYLFTNENEQTYHFCMCNPPFYSNFQELYESRSPSRPPPKNGFTGSPQELITEGGELEFCRKIIKESKNIQNSIRIFTTMVGHKSTLLELIEDLKTIGIKYTHTEFCQGRVTRWGLAWTYQDNDIYKLVPPREKLRKKNIPIVYLLPELPNCTFNIEEAFNKIKNIFQELNITYKVIEKRGHNISVDVIANANTWSNQRRKRRLQKRIQDDTTKKIKFKDPTNGNCMDLNANNQSELLLNTHKAEIDLYNFKHLDKCESSTETKSNNLKNALSPEYFDVSSIPVVHALMKIFKRNNDVLLQMEFYDGTAGKEGLHQIIQYIKNNWK